MENMVTNVYTKSNYERLRIGKALGFRKSDKKFKNKSNIRSDQGPSGPKNCLYNGLALYYTARWSM